MRALTLPLPADWARGGRDGTLGRTGEFRVQGPKVRGRIGGQIRLDLGLWTLDLGPIAWDGTRTAALTLPSPSGLGEGGGRDGTRT